MKTYKSDEELIEYLISKNVKIINKKDTLNKLSKYSYYSIINSYKNIFKNENNEYKDGVTFDEIFSLYEFDKI
ncbi:MAG: Abi family protein [Bacilli bacterium]|nr:Abi family protein [Bacilli bacterium]